jgi:hypoxanthine phosphoribosyltransferase
MSEMPNSRVVYTKAEIDVIIDRLATEVCQRCAEDEWLAICVMQGGLMFTAALLLKLPMKLRQDFVRVTRYRDTTEGGALHWVVRPESDLAGQNVLLLDDIYDEGDTMTALTQEFLAQGARQVVSVVLVEKIHERKTTDYRPDMVGITCHDEYMFGFGMDLEGYWRNLPEIRELVR